MDPLPNGFPAEKRVTNSAQARLSETGVAFLEQNISTLANVLLPGGTTFAIPPSCSGGMPICCSDGSPDTCQIDINLNAQGGDAPRLELTPTAPSRLDLIVRARVRTLQEIDVGGIVGTSCRISLNTTSSGNQSIAITAQLDFKQDPVVGTTYVEMVPGSTALNDLDDGDVDIDGNGGVGSFLVCEGADLLLKGVIVDQVKGIFGDQISGLVGDQLCKTCMTDGDCAPSATCNGENTCIVNGTDRCLQELGVSGRMAAANLFSSLSPGMSGKMDLYLVAGEYASAEANGLSLGLLGGGIAADQGHDPCVPPSTEPDGAGIPESAVLKGNTRPDGMPFHLGIGIHEKFLNRAGWAAYEAGFLCLNVGTRSVDVLTAETFSILVPTLADLLHGQDAPLVLALRPQQPPTFTLGAGTFTPEGEILEPLLTLNMPALQIDFYAFIDERYARIFTLQTDLALPLGLEVNDVGQIVPVIGDVENAFQNIVVTNSQLLEDSAADIAAKFPAILGVAAPLLGDALGGIDLPEVAGLNLKITPGGLTSIEGNTMLAIFTDLAVAGAKPERRVETTAAIVEIQRPATEVFARSGPLVRAERPRVKLALGAAGAPAKGVEWQFRVDKGLWSPYTQNPDHVLGRDGFWLQGRHTVEVRAREIGQPDTTDHTPVELSFVIDSIAPAVVLSGAPGAARVTADDQVTPVEQLEVWYRWDGDADWRFAGAPPLDLELGERDPAGLEVAVRDEAGNVGVATGDVLGFHGRAPAGEGDCACRVGGASGAGRGLGKGGLALMALFGLALVARRRVAAVLVAGAALAALIGCGGSVSGGGDGDGTEIPEGLQPGAMGLYLDMAAGGGRVVAVGYEDRFGDLVMADVTQEGGLLLWPVDGVPAGAPVVDNPDGYRGGVDAPGENVGAHASVALVGGQARVAYRHLDDNALLFGVETGESGWARHVVDDGAAGGVVGLYSSLSVDAAGAPGIAYMAAAVPDGMGGFRSELRWAQAASASPSSSADWTVTVVHSAPISCAGLCGAGEACITSSNQCVTPATDCASPCAEDTEACVAAACVAATPPPATPDLPEGPGLFASAGRSASGEPVVAFYDRTAGDLHLAVQSAGAWSVMPLVVAPETDMGQWASLAVGADGTVHVAFQDALGDSLRYLTVSGGVAGAIELVDDGVRSDRPHPVGAAAALWIDASGQPTVIYQDAATSDVMLSRRDAGGVWSREDLLVGDRGFGFYNAAASDGAATWVGSFTYDRAKFPPGEVIIRSL